MWAQRRQVGKSPLRLPGVLLNKTTETPGLVAVVQMRLVPQIICAVAAMFCQEVAKRGMGKVSQKVSKMKNFPRYTAIYLERNYDPRV
jgi:hypothetical protein|eukprot:SAG25_NODE_275_length_10545_cov_4.715968_11_plen_88_part_00